MRAPQTNERVADTQGLPKQKRSTAKDRISDTVWLIRRSIASDRIANDSGLRAMRSDYEFEDYEGAALKFDHLYLFATSGTFLANPLLRNNNSLKVKQSSTIYISLPSLMGKRVAIA